ncbi:TetR/AcrR family transcriptional regulator [Eubacteriaceae bacterium ES2]|nr:TetR/AcrR family transcriptional regulator [Eubacteriaceae bacterium ES2]
MYHIKEDKRSKTSSAMIYHALVRRLREKPFHEITITEILLESTVSRATFYRAFDKKIDILRMKCDADFARYYESFNTAYKEQPPQEKDMLLFFFEYWYQHREILFILEKINRGDIIQDAFIKTSPIFEKEYMKEMDYDPVAHNYYIASRAGEISSVLMTWCRNQMRHKPEQMVDYMWRNIRIAREKTFIS